MILGILNSKKGMTKGSYLASKLGVSDRTIRSDIRAMASVLREYNAEIESIPGKGYLIHTDQPELLQKLTYREDTFQSPEERVREVVLCLLDCDDPIPIGELEDELFVSRSTLDADLRFIAKRCLEEDPHIRLIRDRQSVCFEQDELKKRRLLNLLLSEKWNYNYEAGMHIQGLPVERHEYEIIERLLFSFLKKQGFHLSEQDYLQFLFSILIAVGRIRGGHEISEYRHFNFEALSKKLQFISDGRVSALAENLVEETGKAVHVTFSKNEVILLSDELIVRMLFNGEFLTERYWKECQDSQCARIISTILEKADTENGLCLGGNLTLKRELLLSVLSCIYNPYYTGLRHSEVIRSLKDENPAAVALAHYFTSEVQRSGLRAEDGLKIRENTQMEIAAYIADAMEKAADEAGRGGVRVIFVSHLPVSSSRYLMAKIRAFFGTRISLDGPLSIYEYRSIGRCSCDYVVSTTKLKRDAGSPPVIVISPLLTKLDLENINFYLNEQRTAALFSRRRSSFSSLCIPEYVRVQQRLQGKKELLEKALEIMKTRAMISDADLTSFIEDGKGDPDPDRIHVSAFSEGFLFALIRSSGSGEELIFGMKLEKPVMIEEVPVNDAYFLIYGDQSEIQPLYALEHMAHIFRRLYQEKSPEKAKYENNLRKLVEMLEIL